MKFIHNVAGFAARTGIAVAFFLITVFILINTYEVAFTQDIPFAQSLVKMQMQQPIDTVINYYRNGGPKEFSQRPPNLGTLDYLYIPSTNVRVYLSRERRIGNDWYQRPNNAHYLSLNTDLNGITGDYLIYTNKSWRTLPNPDDLEVGDKMSLISTRSNQEDYIVQEKFVLKYADKFIAEDSQSGQIIFLVEDSKNDTYYAYLARKEI